MEQVLLDIQRAYPELHIAYHQSNHEGDLIDWVQEYGGLAIGDWRLALGKGQEVDGIVLNAGGYTHTSIALRDAVACSRVPVVEVHVSDIMQREPFRQISLLTDVCAHSVIGQGTDGYRQAVEWILNRTTQHTDE
jgi:3-dehydroquinate dehydratase-2